MEQEQDLESPHILGVLFDRRKVVGFENSNFLTFSFFTSSFFSQLSVQFVPDFNRPFGLWR